MSKALAHRLRHSTYPFTTYTHIHTYNAKTLNRRPGWPVRRLASTKAIYPLWYWKFIAIKNRLSWTHKAEGRNARRWKWKMAHICSFQKEMRWQLTGIPQMSVNHSKLFWEEMHTVCMRRSSRCVPCPRQPYLHFKGFTYVHAPIHATTQTGEVEMQAISN